MLHIASDHRGFELKTRIIEYYKSLEISITDYGSYTNERCDFPDFCIPLCRNIKNNDIGILICGTGIGMSICANKIKNINCALCRTVDEARLAREHNHANVISLKADMELKLVLEILETFIKTSKSNDENYCRRNKKIKDII